MIDPRNLKKWLIIIAVLYLVFPRDLIPDFFGRGLGLIDDLLLIALPAAIPSPEVAFDPDGDVLLEWFSDQARMLSVSVGTAGEIRFALRTPAAKLTGIEAFADEVPPGLAHALETFRR